MIYTKHFHDPAKWRTLPQKDPKHFHDPCKMVYPLAERPQTFS